MRGVLASLALTVSSSVAAGVAFGDHGDLMAFSFGGALGLSLQEFDRCHFGTESGGGTGDTEVPLDRRDMSADCRTLLEPCHGRMHLDAGIVPRDAAVRMLLIRCLREDTGRFYILLQRHALDVLGNLPDGVDEAARADAVARRIEAPQDAATEAAAGCFGSVPEDDETRVLMCARDWRYDQVLRSRRAVREAAP